MNSHSASRLAAFAYLLIFQINSKHSLISFNTEMNYVAKRTFKFLDYGSAEHQPLHANKLGLD
jgi:hypothetical protein